MAKLTDLPNEVFDIMCRSADSTSSLKALRVTSRDMHEQVEDVFADRTFSHIEVSLNGTSFHYLQSVAHHPIYSGNVRSITFIPTYRMSIQKHEEIWERSFDVEMLARTLLQLRNLKRIQIGRPLASHERNAPIWSVDGRFRGGPKARFTDQTWTTHDPSSAISFLSQAFHVLIQALNKSGKQLDKISAGFKPYGEGKRNSIDQLSLVLPEIQHLTTSLSCLRNLELVLETRSNTSGVHGETYLADLLKQTKNLENLKLSFPQNGSAWLAGFPSVHLPSLSSLVITKAHRVYSAELYDFIARHQKLKILKLTLVQFNQLDPFEGLLDCLQGLKLNEIHLQQLTSLRKNVKLMLFGGDTTKICETCYEDLEAAFSYVEGPGCGHATISVKGEHEVNTALKLRLQGRGYLMRRRR